MTEKIIKKEDVEYKLACTLSMEWNRPAYRFKLQQRERGKRKWRDLFGEGRWFDTKTKRWEKVVGNSNQQIKEDIKKGTPVKKATTPPPSSNTKVINSRGADSKEKAEKEFIEKEFNTLSGECIVTGKHHIVTGKQIGRAHV